LTRDRTASAPLYEVIYDALRDHIGGRRLMHGLVLTESNVARAFKASRVPVRAALRRLSAEGLVNEFDGRGFLVGSRDAPPLRIDLEEGGFHIQPQLEAQLGARNRWEQIYPDIEHAIAVCLAYGRFMINESSLAEHYEVSRTVAHEVLTRLERTGIINRDQSQRWYAGPLTAKNIREHFEIRWLLEPVALRQAFPLLDQRELKKRRDRVARAKEGRPSPDKLERMEFDLHVDAISRCDNTLVLETIRRSQLPLFAAHTSFHRFQRAEDFRFMASDHMTILDHLIAGQPKAATAVLESHIKRSVKPFIEIWEQLGEIPEAMLPSYMARAFQR
jgi:DNA-binding GntR family transcriptional regulator